MNTLDAYIAVKECGCVADVVVDQPEARKHIAKQVANWIRCGYVVQRATYPVGHLPDLRRVCHHDNLQLGLMQMED